MKTNRQSAIERINKLYAGARPAERQKLLDLVEARSNYVEYRADFDKLDDDFNPKFIVDYVVKHNPDLDLRAVPTAEQVLAAEKITDPTARLARFRQLQKLDDKALMALGETLKLFDAPADAPKAKPEPAPAAVTLPAQGQGMSEADVATLYNARTGLDFRHLTASKRIEVAALYRKAPDAAQAAAHRTVVDLQHQIAAGRTLTPSERISLDRAKKKVA